jgi:hypothetical protein
MNLKADAKDCGYLPELANFSHLNKDQKSNASKNQSEFNAIHRRGVKTVREIGDFSARKED